MARLSEFYGNLKFALLIPVIIVLAIILEINLRRADKRGDFNV